MSLWGALVLGLVHAGHCAGMCGGFAIMASGSGRGWLGLITWLGGKTFTYVFLGALAGRAGQVVADQGAAYVPVLGGTVGGLLALAGAARLMGVSADFGGAAVSRMLGPMARDAGRLGGRFGLGVVTGLLPCGVTWLAVLASAPHGPGGGAMFMFIFGLATAPVLIAMGLFGRGVMARLGPKRWERLAGFVVLVSGVMLLVRSLYDPGSCPTCSA